MAAANAVSTGALSSLVIRMQFGESGQGGSGFVASLLLGISDGCEPQPVKKDIPKTEINNNINLFMERNMIEAFLNSISNF